MNSFLKWSNSSLAILICIWTAYASWPPLCASQDRRDTGVAQTTKPDTARLAIDFDAIDLKKQPFHGRSLKGKIVLLDFWAVWCKPCIAAFPTLEKLNKDFKDKNFEVVGVAVYSGGPEDVSKFLKQHELDYKIVVGDADLALRFGVIGYPSYFLVGPDGKVLKKYVGEAKDLYSEVKREILKLQTIKSK